MSTPNHLLYYESPTILVGFFIGSKDRFVFSAYNFKNANG